MFQGPSIHIFPMYSHAFEARTWTHFLQRNYSCKGIKWKQNFIVFPAYQHPLIILVLPCSRGVAFKARTWVYFLQRHFSCKGIKWKLNFLAFLEMLTLLWSKPCPQGWGSLQLLLIFFPCSHACSHAFKARTWVYFLQRNFSFKGIK